MEIITKNLSDFRARRNIIMDSVKEVDEGSALAEKEYLEEMKRLDEEEEESESKYQRECEELMEIYKNK